MSSERVRFEVAADAGAAALAAAEALADRARRADGAFHVALSGGSTPRLLFQRLASEPYRTSVPWERVHVWWGDERCVPPGDAESNYRMAREALLDHVPLPAAQIHRIRGEDDPAQEWARYERELVATVPKGRGGLPRLDVVLLGVGDDGHTASLFPGQTLEPSGRLCGVARHPASGQHRISFTAALIDAAAEVFFLVTGPSKAPVVGAIRRGAREAQAWPAAHVAAKQGDDDGDVVWFLDEAAARS